MKVNIKSYIKRVLPLFIVGAALTACEDFLDKQPPSYIVPEDYYRSEDQILASANLHGSLAFARRQLRNIPVGCSY